MGKLLNKPSKRISCRLKYKIAKKIREHIRKKRREAKRMGNKGFNRNSRNLIVIPNQCPFKEEILKDVEEYKKQVALEKEKERKTLMERKNQMANSLEEMVENAQMRQLELEESENADTSDTQDLVRQHDSVGQYRNFYREFHKVVAAADVILEVVDSRDPLGTRCPNIQECVREAGNGKRLVLVLNKADLVPMDILQKWLKYLRRFVPCIPFKSSTQSQNNNLGRRKLMKNQDIKSNGICVGAEGLTSLLANYTRNKGIKTSIKVGVVGLPNVGKSSLINSLKRSRACKVGAVPGVTRVLQEVQLDSKIQLLDCPGLAFASSSDPQAGLKNAMFLSDCTEAAEMIVSRAQKEDLIKLYLIPNFDTFEEFLSSLARRYGRFKKGGVPDVAAAAKVVVNDWYKGKISYHTEPPEDSNDYEISSSIVTSEVAEFDLDSYDQKVFPEDLGEPMESGPSTSGENRRYLVICVKNKKKGDKPGEEDKKINSLMQLEGNLKLNKILKIKYKKIKKEKNRDSSKGDALAEIMQNVKL